MTLVGQIIFRADAQVQRGGEIPRDVTHQVIQEGNSRNFPVAAKRKKEPPSLSGMEDTRLTYMSTFDEQGVRCPVSGGLVYVRTRNTCLKKRGPRIVLGRVEPGRCEQASYAVDSKTRIDGVS